MKRIVATLFVLLSVTAVCQARKTPGKSRVQGLVNEMRAEARLAGIDSDREAVTLPGIKVVSEANVEMVSIGGVALKFGKMVSGLDRELPIMRGVTGMTVVDYSGCPDAVKDRFNARMESELRGCELLMEAKDGNEKMSCYGTTSNDGDRISDIIMFVPQDGALICFFGTISARDLSELVNSTDW
jgi:hypothetical protein